MALSTRFQALLKQELGRIDSAGSAKRHEKVIDRYFFEEGHAPQAVIAGKKYLVFNSNDYLGLRFNPKLRKAEEEAAEQLGSGPGAVRFISGTSKYHKALEKKLAAFHGREDAMLFSSAFSANLAVIHCLIKGQSKDSLVRDTTLVVSDELNHRSIIDGIRVAGLAKENKAIFRHFDLGQLRSILDENRGKFQRVLVISDGVFSMLGEYQDLRKIRKICNEYSPAYPEGVLMVIDDCHGVATLGGTGRGTEEACGAKADVLIGTLGKGFGAEGGYCVGDKVLIDYLREAAATYIYSNPVSAGIAAAGAESVDIINGKEGALLLDRLHENIAYFKKQMLAAGFRFLAESWHPIQPVSTKSPEQTKKLVDLLFKQGILVTNINYPVVPKGQDEIRVQVNATHTKADIDEFVDKAKKAAKACDII